jgi:hypothetical protein
MGSKLDPTGTTLRPWILDSKSKIHSPAVCRLQRAELVETGKAIHYSMTADHGVSRGKPTCPLFARARANRRLTIQSNASLYGTTGR